MKKKLNIILLLVVAGLWGTVTYRFINNYFFPGTTTLASSVNYKDMSTKNLNVKRDTFLLEVIQRDPFLNHTISDDKLKPAHILNNNKKKAKIQTKKTISQPPVKMPEIAYYGYIKSGKNEELVVLQIDKKIIRMHKGQSNNGIKINHIYRDSVAVLYNNEKFIIKLK